MVIALACVLVSMIMEKGNPAALLAPPAMVLVLGGTIGIALATIRLKDLGGVVKAARRAILAKKSHDGPATVEELMSFADVARRQGLLALEEQVKDVHDPFLRRGLELVIDGTDSEEVAVALYSELDALRDRHKGAAQFFTDMGGFAPTLGIIGTVIGLVHALEGLTNPAGLGHAISAAFLATLWGILSANVFWLPLSSKLKRISAVEVAHRQLCIQGILAIQAGVSPRAVGERLKSHLAPAQREVVGADKGQEKISA